MISVLIMLVFYTNNPMPERQSVIFPSEALCEASKNGIAEALTKQQKELVEQGVSKVLIACVPAKEA